MAEKTTEEPGMMIQLIQPAEPLFKTDYAFKAYNQEPDSIDRTAYSMLGYISVPGTGYAPAKGKEGMAAVEAAATPSLLADRKPTPAPSPLGAAGMQAPIQPLLEQSPATKLSSEEIASAGEYAKVDTAAPAAEKSGGFGQMMKGVGTSVLSSAVSSLSQNMVDSNIRQYNEEFNNRINEGKYWFDPDNNVEPDVEAMLDELPTMTEALSDSTFTQGIMSKMYDTDTKGGKARSAASYLTATHFDPLGQGIESMLGPEYDGMAEYVFHKTGERGLQGYASTGSPFGLLMGLVGVVEGIMTWNSAVEQDRERKNAARKAYEQALKKWHEQRRELSDLTKSQRATEQIMSREAREAKEKADELEEFKVEAMRKNLISQFTQAANTSRARKISTQPQYMALS